MLNKKIIIIDQSSRKQQEQIVLSEDCLVFELIDQESQLKQKLKTEIIIKDNVLVDYVFVLNQQGSLFSEARVIKLGINSVLHNYYFYLQSPAELSLNQYLDSHSHLEHQVFVYLNNDLHFSLQENNNFLYPAGEGSIKIITLADDRARINYFSDLLIKKAAINTEARLEMEAFIWSKEAKVNLTPGLSVEPNQVKASHAAKISHLSPEQSFYLQNRALTEAQIKKLIWQSLLDKLTVKINHPEIKNRLDNLLNKIKFYEQNS
ncbi:SufD family Fe-S cluster assembly protein [Candidatus Nomurabacteria bacterium]|nr:SufD family Fe-S cluster assembly protein [Candidatus Nomurabacteria bacterium]